MASAFFVCQIAALVYLFNITALSPHNAELSENRGILISRDPLATRVSLEILYPFQSSITSHANLAEKWKLILLEELLQHRLAQCTKQMNALWIPTTPRGILPSLGRAIATEEQYETLLAHLLWQVETIRLHGFSPQEFSDAKQRLSRNVYNACPLVYTHAIHSSQDVLEDIPLSALSLLLEQYLHNEQRRIRIICPENTPSFSLTSSKIEEIGEKAVLLALWQPAYLPEAPAPIMERPFQIGIQENQTEPTLIQFADHSPPPEIPLSFVNNPSSSEPEVDTFYPLNEEEKRLVHKLLKKIAEKSLWALIFKKKEMDELGDRIEKNIHPMRFITHIIADPELRKYLHKVKKSSPKWDRFIAGFARRMKEENANNNVHSHIPGMARILNVQQDKIIHYIKSKDYEGLVRSMM